MILFWRNVREHYTWKKKHLIQFIDPDYFIDATTNFANLPTYQHLSYDELQSIYEKCETNVGTEKYYVKILLDQFEPLKPPYSKEEMNEMMTTLPSDQIGIPNDLYEYLTQVSREQLFFNTYAIMIDLHNIKSYHDHVTSIEELCDYFPDIYTKLPEEEKEKLHQDIERHNKERNLLQIDGIYLGANSGSWGGEKIIACRKNGQFGKIYKNGDDSYSGCYDMYEEYAKSLKELIEIKMEREKNSIYDYDSDCYSGDIYREQK